MEIKVQLLYMFINNLLSSNMFLKTKFILPYKFQIFKLKITKIIK